LRGIITAKINISLVKGLRISMAKCLSIRESYAELVIPGRKTKQLNVENGIQDLEENS
jgi:hypothetical protein